MANYSEFELQFRVVKTARHSNDAVSWICGTGHTAAGPRRKLPVQRRPIADTPWIRRKNSQASFALPKIGLPN